MEAGRVHRVRTACLCPKTHTHGARLLGFAELPERPLVAGAM